MEPILLAWIVKLSAHFITNLLDIKDPNIKSVDIINMEPQKKITEEIWFSKKI